MFRSMRLALAAAVSVACLVSFQPTDAEAEPIYVCVGPCVNIIPIPGEPPIVPGNLVQIFNVPIGSTLYDVAFVDDTFNGIFGSGASPTLLFTTGAAAGQAAQALSNVLTDGPAGDFDSAPFLTNGCSNNQGCGVETPFEVLPDGFGFRYIAFENVSPLFPDVEDSIQPPDLLGLNGARPQDLGEIDNATFAVWRLAGGPPDSDGNPNPLNRYFVSPVAPPNQVPLPGMLALFAFGLLALACHRNSLSEVGPR